MQPLGQAKTVLLVVSLMDLARTYLWSMDYVEQMLYDQVGWEGFVNGA